MPTELRTTRLLLRQWRDTDRAPFAALNADPEVMEHFPATRTTDESNAAVDGYAAAIAARGWGLWAVEVVQTGAFAGYVGLNPPAFEAHFTPAVEVGWRLARPFWGQGLASEAATAALDHAFGPLGLDEVVSFTATTNLRSQAVMERLGMTRDRAEDFDVPTIAAGNPLRRHVLYRLSADGWRRRARLPHN